MYRKKLGGSYRRAPVMIDKIQATGTIPRLTWSGSTGVTGQNFPFANHLDGTGNSSGGNFLYEDGSVSWPKFSVAKRRHQQAVSELEMRCFLGSDCPPA